MAEFQPDSLDIDSLIMDLDPAQSSQSQPTHKSVAMQELSAWQISSLDPYRYSD